MRREWIEIVSFGYHIVEARSPSMRREWIEIVSEKGLVTNDRVSLHAEGVD